MRGWTLRRRASFGLAAAMLAGCAYEGISGYDGPITYEMTSQGHGHWRDMAIHMANAATAAPDNGLELAMWSLHNFTVVISPRTHTLPIGVGSSTPSLSNACLDYYHNYDDDDGDYQCHDCGPRLWPTTVAHDCGPRLRPTTVARGCIHDYSSHD